MGGCLGKKIASGAGDSKRKKSPSDIWDWQKIVIEEFTILKYTNLWNILEEKTLVSAEKRQEILEQCLARQQQLARILGHIGHDDDKKIRLYEALQESGQEYILKYINHRSKEQDPKELTLNTIKNFTATHYAFTQNKEGSWYKDDDLKARWTSCEIPKLYAEGSDASLENYLDILQVQTKPVRILLHGERGIGKSTMLRQIAADWGHAVLSELGRQSLHLQEDGVEMESVDNGLHKFDLVLRIQLKFLFGNGHPDNHTNDPVLTLVNSTFWSLRPCEKEVICQLIYKYPSRVLILLDDLDCCPARYQPVFMKLVEGSVLQDSVCITTSRNSCLPGDLSSYCLWKYEVKGLTKFQVETFAAEFANGSLENDGDKVMADMQKAIGLKGNTNGENKRVSIHALIGGQSELAPELLRYVPVLHAHCKLWENHKDVPKTWTGTYKALVAKYLECHQKDQHGLVAGDGLFEEYKEELMQLGRVAFDFLMSEQEQPAFKRTWLKQQYYLTDRVWELGILTMRCVGTLEDDPIFLFEHSFLIDFLAAFYLTRDCDTASTEEREQQLLMSCADLSKLFQFQTVFKIACGLSHRSGNRLMRAIVANYEDSFAPQEALEFNNFLLRCLSEYDDTNMARFPLPSVIRTEISYQLLDMQEVYFSMKQRNGPEYGKVSVLYLSVHPTLKFSEKIVNDLLHPLTSGPLTELHINCGDSMTREGYQQLYNEIKFMKNLTTFSLVIYRRHKDEHFFRSLLTKLAVLQKLSSIEVKIENPDIPAPLGQNFCGSPYSSFSLGSKL